MPDLRERLTGSFIVCYGGGTNSTALLVGLYEREITPVAIVFADTGGEKPHTYEYVWMMSRWCELAGFPSITIVRASTPMNVRDGSLEGECRRLGTIPSRAMGFGACSDKWKVAPFEKWLKTSAWRDTAVTMIGYDADEPGRAARHERYGRPCRYPLIEWEWGREECVEALIRAGLRDPGKSACFFCPSSKKHEIRQLAVQYPDLLARALDMESRALVGAGPAPALHSCKGLGRRFSWAQFLASEDQQSSLFDSTPEMCGEGCFT